MDVQTNSGPLTDAAEVVSMDADEALDHFNQYKAALRVTRSQHDHMMREVYRALSKGLGV